MNCFEFVHLCNILTCCDDHPRNLGFNNLETQLFDVKAGFNEWDGKTPIPRGSVVVGTTPAFGTSRKGVYHVGISVGDGQVVSNRHEKNVVSEPANDVFGSSFYKVYYGPYPHCACHESFEEHRTHEHGYPLPSTGPLHELPSLSKQNAQRIVAAAGVLILAAASVGTVTFGGLFSSPPPEPTPLPTLARVTTPPPTPRPATTAPLLVGAPLLAGPIKATFTQSAFTTTYAATIDPGGNAFTYRWAGPNCGTWDSTAEKSVAAQNASFSITFAWQHPHPPCAVTTDHRDVTVTLSVTWSGGTLVCAYEGSETGTGPVCRKL